MAFVPAPGAAPPASAFRGASVSARRAAPHLRAPTRMSADPAPGGDSPVFGKAGKSMWKENYFTGGFPGGEAFYKAWAEDGMTKDVPDVPASMQAAVAFKPKVEAKGGILGKLDSLEFFKEFVGSAPDAADGGAADDAGVPAAEDAPPDVRSEEDAPDESLYAPYFPAATRFLAPDINICYEKSFAKDRVYMAMTEVTASPADVYFPKEMKNKAPIIEISYNGSLAGASISVRLGDVEGLPTLPPPAKPGDAVTTLVPGPGGGLKLDFSVEGQGPVNI